MVLWTANFRQQIIKIKLSNLTESLFVIRTSLTVTCQNGRNGPKTLIWETIFQGQNSSYFRSYIFFLIFQHQFCCGRTPPSSDWRRAKQGLFLKPHINTCRLYCTWKPFITFPCFPLICYAFFPSYRGQEQHIRFEHIYLPESNSQSEVEYAEIKRPRLEMGPESLMRHSAHRPSLPLGGAEDMAKVSGDIWHVFP